QPGGQPQLVPVPEFGRGPNLTLSADGRRLALWQPGGPTEVVIREVAPAESEAAQKVATGRPTWVVFSPDGRWLLLGEPAERQLRVVSAEPERLATVALAPSE
ncbi:MAG: hypothetical protein HUU35_10765, partial [Armatimonadetes bacterium]|nr:hypothetical protein [Armatimonadota bacterium]